MVILEYTYIDARTLRNDYIAFLIELDGSSNWIAGDEELTYRVGPYIFADANYVSEEDAEKQRELDLLLYGYVPIRQTVVSGYFN